MDKKSKELIRHENNNSKNQNKLEGLQQKAEKTFKEQKSKSVNNLSKEKPILKAKEREREKEKEKEEHKVLKNNFFEKHKSEKTVNANNDKNNNYNNKFAVVYSKKGEFNDISSGNKHDVIMQQQRLNDSEDYERNNQNEDLNASDNYNENDQDEGNLNIEQTKRQNFITDESNFNSNNNNLAKAKAKPKSLPKDQQEIKQEMKLKKNNYVENQKKFAANLMEQNMKKMKEQQLQQANNKNAKSESAEENNNNNNNKEKPIIPGRKPNSQNSYNIKANANNNNINNFQNKSRITNPNEKSNKLEHINKIFTTEEKLENIEKINDCFEKLEIKKVERESLDKIKKKVALVQKKLRVLQEKGIELNLDETNNNNENIENEVANKNFNNEEQEQEEEEKNYVFHDSDNNVEKENISSKNLNSNSDNNIKSIKDNNNYKNNNYHDREDKLNFENVSKIKNYNNNINLLQQQQHKKPVVDTLEFVKKIQESRRKFASKSPGKSEILNRSDSFRRSNSESNNQKSNLKNNNNNNKFNINDYQDNNENQDINNNLEILTNKLLAAAANNNMSEADKRLKDLEIKQFIDRKKKEKKMVELKIQEENRKNWENKVLQLLQLEKTINTQNEKVNYLKKNNSSNSTQNYSRQSNSANKVRNDFYIGTKKLNSNNNNNNNNLDESSILDPDDFYYTVLESKNIIVTQKSQSSNKINSMSVKNSNKSTANELNNNFNFKTSDDFLKQNAASRLSDFTQGNHNEIRKSDYNFNFTNNAADNRKVSSNVNVTNKLSQENFLKFITENEKITLRSLDSKNSGNNVNNVNYNAETKHALKNIINNNKGNNNYKNNITNSPSDLKLTTDSKLIGSKSSNFNNAMQKSDNLFENNLENNAKKQQQTQLKLQFKSENISEEKDLSNSPKFEKASSVAAKKTENKNELSINENKAEISDLNNNNNNLSEHLIDRSDIEKDSFLLQFDNLLMTFANKLKHVYLRKHLSELFNNIIMKEQINYCYETLSNLCNLGKRAVFNRLNQHASEVHVENIYSVFNNLTLFAKRNAMKRLFQFFSFIKNLEISENNNNIMKEIENENENLNENEDDDYENLDTKNIEEIKAQYLTYFVGIINRSFLLLKKDAIERVFEYAKNFSLYNDMHLSSGENFENNNNYNNNTGQQRKQALATKSSAGAESLEESEYSFSEQEKIAKYYEYVKSTFDLMTRHIRKDAYYRIKAFSEAKRHKKQIKSIESFNNNNNNTYTNRDNDNSSFNSERKRNSEKIVLSKKSANGENSFSSVFNQNKANSFIAQSHNSSNFSLHPNSLDSPKIRKLQFKIAQKNMEREWLDNIDSKYANNNSRDSGNANNQHNRNASSDNNENKSNTSFSNNNLNLHLNANSPGNMKDNPLARSDDENEESKNINYSKLSLDDPFKDSKKKFYEAASASNSNNENKVKVDLNKINNNKNLNNKNNNNENDNSLISNSNKNNNSMSININKYSTVNYNDELNLNLGPATDEAEKKKQISSDSSQIQHNNRYGSNENFNENSFNSALLNKKNHNLANNITKAAEDDKFNLNIVKTLNHNLDENAEKNLSKNTAFDAAGNLKAESQTPLKPKSDRESIHEEIVEDIAEENFEVLNSNMKKNSIKDASGRFLRTDIDLSADRDNTSDIDWIYTVSQSKSGSLRDVTGGSLVKQFADLTAKNEETNNYNNKATNLNKEKEEPNNLRNSVSIGYESSDNNKKGEKETSFSFNNNINNKQNNTNNKKQHELESKIKEMQIDPASAAAAVALRKSTEEDYENNYNDFENIEEDIVVDDEADFAKLIGEDSTSNVQHGSLIKSRNSFKNSSLQEEKLIKEKEAEDAKNKEAAAAAVAAAAEELKKGFSQNAEEKEIDLSNKKFNLNVIPGKETIESLKDIKSIESEDNDFFRIKNNNNQNILNLLDDKSSNNKSASVSVNLLSQLSPDLGLFSDGTSSYNLKDVQLNRETINTDYLTALDKKSENTISTLNRKPENAAVASKESLLPASNNLINNNNRYENIENSVKKLEAPSGAAEKEYLSSAEMDSLSSELAEILLKDLIASEIKDREKNLIPKKIFKSEAGLVNMLNSLNGTPLNRSLLSLDSSISYGSINNTLFSKTVLEQKKENSMKLYIEQIGPKLIDSIVDDVAKSNFFMFLNFVKKIIFVFFVILLFVFEFITKFLFIRFRWSL